jgi:hypothetical protein
MTSWVWGEYSPQCRRMFTARVSGDWEALPRSTATGSLGLDAASAAIYDSSQIERTRTVAVDGAAGLAPPVTAHFTDWTRSFPVVIRDGAHLCGVEPNYTLETGLVAPGIPLFVREVARVPGPHKITPSP